VTSSPSCPACLVSRKFAPPQESQIYSPLVAQHSTVRSSNLNMHLASYCARIGNKSMFRPQALCGNLHQHRLSGRISVKDVTLSRRRVSSAMALAPRKVDSVLLLSNAFNSMSQRLWLNLLEQGYQVHFESVENEEEIGQIYREKVMDGNGGFNFDVVLCPFLTKRIPEELFLATPEGAPKVLIVHPGIKGDRGISSIEWCLLDPHNSNDGDGDYWGVTVLEADEEMDCGAIWSSKNFELARDCTNYPLSKSNLYQKEIISTAAQCVDEALFKMKCGVAPEPLNYDEPAVKGKLRPTMKAADRRIDWHCDAERVCQVINGVTSRPGALGVIDGDEYLVFGAHAEWQLDQHSFSDSVPGTPLFVKNDAVLISTATKPVWVSALKKKGRDEIKLPAAMVLEGVGSIPNHVERPLASSHNDLWYEIRGDVVFVHFDFLNGAMDTRKCVRLQALLNEISSLKQRVVVLMGGYQYFGNGINLNTIEHAPDPEVESFRNIEAIDDVIKSLISCFPDKLLISAIQGNCGAGGCMLGLVADLVWTHQATIFNPHYKLMALKGSEYWTFFLPQRVGSRNAELLTDLPLPISATMAKSLGVVDEVFGENTEEFRGRLEQRVSELVHHPLFDQILAAKFERNTRLEWVRKAESHRNEEIAEMMTNFGSAAYKEKRHNFVHKVYEKKVVSWDEAKQLKALVSGSDTDFADLLLRVVPIGRTVSNAQSTGV